MRRLHLTLLAGVLLVFGGRSAPKVDALVGPVNAGELREGAFTPQIADDGAAVEGPIGRAERGLLVRIYDIGEPMRGLPELAGGQRPNMVKVVPTLDLSSGGFGPFKEHFVTEVVGELHVSEAGSYDFRLISDDGSRLWIDRRTIINHDGLHRSTPKDGAVELTAGVHSLRVRHFESTGGERLALHWKPPGANDFTLIPASALRVDPAESRATSPGRKRIIKPLRRGPPGDGSSLAGPHPSFDGSGSELRGGHELMSWLSNGRLLEMGRAKTPPSSTLVAWLPADKEAGACDLVVKFVIELDQAPYSGQMVVASFEVESLRLFVESVSGRQQGCVFRFGHLDGQLRSDGEPTFEILAVRAMSSGMELEFTQPVDPRVGWEAGSYYVEQWPWAAGNPQRDGSSIPVKSASVSQDRRRVFLEIDGLLAGHVVYLRLLPPCLSKDGALPRSTEAWYTLRTIPTDRPGVVLAPPASEPRNVLTEEERRAGWRLLFDGKTTAGWRGFNKDAFPHQGWKVIDGSLVRVGPGGDIATEEEFDDFELKLEWRISAGGNSGIFYNVGAGNAPWLTGPEMQILDNAQHGDGQNHKTSAGSNYALHAPTRDVTKPVGLFNEARIVIDGNRVEHWLNGVKIVEYELLSEEWEKLVAASKFKSMPRYGRMSRGRIVLQDHGDKVWYRNIKIRPF